jgi:hypothetical protein
VLQKCLALSRDVGNKQKFEELNESEILATTIASQKVLNKLSFYEDGILHSANNLKKAVEKGDNLAVTANKKKFLTGINKITDLIREDLRKFSGK